MRKSMLSSPGLYTDHVEVNQAVCLRRAIIFENLNTNDRISLIQFEMHISHCCQGIIHEFHLFFLHLSFPLVKVSRARALP